MLPRVPAVALLVAASAFAGCFGAEAVPDERSFSASGGSASPGWAYDGVGLAPAGASLSGFLVDSANAGVVNVTFDFAGSSWSVVFDSFAQASGRDFQDGGVEFALDEHGDTGVADASIPRIHAIVAAWGSARVERDGVLAAPEPWSAHLMISEETVRGPDGRIAKADGAAPYDPATPADARRIEGDPQAIFWVKHPQGETFQREPAAVTAAVSCRGPQCSDAAELAIEEGARTLELNLTLVGPEATLPVGTLGQGRVALVDANGTELAGVDVAPTPQAGGPVVLGPLALTGVARPISLTLTGQGAFGAQASGTVTYDDVPFLVLTWDEVAFS